MTRRWLAAMVLVALPAVVRAQAVVTELQQSGGVSTDESSGTSTQLRIFGEPAKGFRFKIETSYGRQFGEESDLLGTAYPYGGRADLVEAYAEYLLPRGFVRSVRGGRYRTPFGISAASEHAYIGFMRPPLVRYGEYYALSSGYMEHGAEVVIGTSHVSGDVSVGRPADIGEAIRRPGVDTVTRVEASTESLIVGASFIDTTPYLPSFFAHGRARFGGIDVRWMQRGVELRGEWLHGQPFRGVTTKGGYLDAIVHRPVMGPLTAIARVETLSYDTIPQYALHTSRYQAGVRARLWQGLSVSAGTSHQAGQQTQYRRTALDLSVSYAVQAHF